MMLSRNSASRERNIDSLYMPLNPFKDCMQGKSKLTLIVKSNCFRSKKLVFHVNVRDPEEMDRIFDDIKKVIQRYDSLSSLDTKPNPTSPSNNVSASS